MVASNRYAFALFGICVLTILLWLPGTVYYIPFADTATYALLGESLWNEGLYSLFGEPYAKQLPLHAIVSYPFTVLFNMHIGMQVSSLIAGLGTLIATYLLVSRSFSPREGVLATFFVAIHHGFVLITMQGSADLLFTFLFLMAGYFYLLAEDDQRFYIPSGVATGLACLARYNGVPLFLLFGFYTLWRRRAHLKRFWFWIGYGLGALLFGLWPLRNFIIFGNPFESDYAGDFAENSLPFFSQLLNNIFYYLNPLHNILPILLLFAVYGLWKKGRDHSFLVFLMFTAWVLTSFWYVNGIRFAFTGYPILLGFAAFAFFDLLKHSRFIIAYSLFVLIVMTHAGALCMYSFGACNAFVDRHIGIAPAYLGLTPEGIYAWNVARRYANEHLPTGAYFFTDDKVDAAVWDRTMFRDDIIVTSDKNNCPAYWITQRPDQNADILFTTQSAPRTSLVRLSCDQE